MDRLEQFIAMSKYAGGRFDLVQAGGGNSSVKLDDGTMLIKASGHLLSEVERDRGYCRVNNDRILGILGEEAHQALERRRRDAVVAGRVNDAVVGESSLRPSIETLLHSLLHRYTLHTHPLVVNAVTCRSDWRELLGGLFSDSLLVDYRTPGIELALELKREIGLRGGVAPQVVFLQNHGMITTSDVFEEVEELTEEVLRRLEQHLAVDLGRYRLATPVARLVNRFGDGRNIACLSEDCELARLLRTDRDIFFALPFCPDKMVFCGARALEIGDEQDSGAVEAYLSEFHDIPRVIVMGDRLFFIAPNQRKAREAEEAFKFHVMALKLAGGDIRCLPPDELSYLGNWEAEKYRQKL